MILSKFIQQDSGTFIIKSDFVSKSKLNHLICSPVILTLQHMSYVTI